MSSDFRHRNGMICRYEIAMNRIATRHRTALNVLTAAMFPVLDSITDIEPMITGEQQIDDAMRPISNSVRPVMAAIFEVNRKHIAILDEIADTNRGNRGNLVVSRCH